MTNNSTTDAIPRRVLVAGLLTFGLLAPAAACAAPLASLKGQGFDAFYSDYAPRGDCRSTTGLTIGDSGFVFRVLRRTVRPPMVDYAPSFMGQAYDGITAVFFPFPRSSEDPGRVVMYVNDDEKPGRIRFEADVPPGQRPARRKVPAYRSEAPQPDRRRAAPAYTLSRPSHGAARHASHHYADFPLVALV